MTTSLPVKHGYSLAQFKNLLFYNFILVKKIYRVNESKPYLQIQELYQAEVQVILIEH